jgi:threonine synthase
MTVLVCPRCGAEHDVLRADVECERCGDLLEARNPAPGMSGEELKRVFGDRRATAPRSQAAGGRTRPDVDHSGVWRYRELVLPDAAEWIVTYPEGNTPLLHRTAVAKWAGASILLKHEGLNPTGSFKDRGMAVALTHARQVSATAVLCASTGNTSSSMAAYGAIAGIPALVLVPSGNISKAKLAQAVAYGARTLAVRGDFDACLRLAREAATAFGIYLANSVNPFRLLGQKTIIFEMLEQLAWSPPDWIALPAGNLGNTSAFGAALREALALGLIDRVPRLLLAQASGAAPFFRGFQENFAARHRVTPETVATAIRIGDPASHDRAVRAIRETSGVVVAVSDAEIMEAKRVIDRAGVGCEPASAASVAAVRQCVGAGTIAPDARVVAVLTGHLLKDVGAIDVDSATGGKGAGGDAPAVIEIDPTLADVERVMSKLA